MHCAIRSLILLHSALLFTSQSPAVYFTVPCCFLHCEDSKPSFWWGRNDTQTDRKSLRRPSQLCHQGSPQSLYSKSRHTHTHTHTHKHTHTHAHTHTQGSPPPLYSKSRHTHTHKRRATPHHCTQSQGTHTQTQDNPRHCTQSQGTHTHVQTHSHSGQPPVILLNVEAHCCFTHTLPTDWCNTHTHKHIYTYTHTYTHKHIHTQTHTNAHPCTLGLHILLPNSQCKHRQYIHLQIYTNTHIQSRKHSHTHTHGGYTHCHPTHSESIANGHTYTNRYT